MEQLLYITECFKEQQDFFNTNTTLDYNFRIEQLKKLRIAIVNNKQQIIDALYKDLHRPEFEAYFELELVKEIDYVIKKLKSWMKVKTYLPSINQFPGIGYRQPQAIGNVLIISPWNYPIELTFKPLIGAIAAGVCVIIKPSELSVNCSSVIKKIINDNFDKKYLHVIEGGIEESNHLLQLNFNHIFFTGSTSVGKIVAQAAAKNLTPVTLELGGKSPAIVCQDADLKLTAKRILWGKLINAGQTCIAPDYVLVDEKIYDSLITEFKTVLNQFYPQGTKDSSDFSRIINNKNFLRLVNFINQSKVIVGGGYDEKTNYIEPTIVDVSHETDIIMQEEIFGSILPIVKFNNLVDELTKLKLKEKPLALYLFTNDKYIQQTIQAQILSGSMAINDCVLQITNHNLPFGGVGSSGMGGYHGKHTFDTFTYYKTVLKSFKLELPWRYAPYSKLKIKFMQFMTK